MVINASDFTEEQIKSLKRRARKIQVKSNFSFLQEHRGLRLGALHVLMGTAGSGKSTVTRAILSDMLKINPDSVYMFLSEESSEDFMVEFINNEVSRENLSKLHIESEQDSGNDNLDEILERVAFVNAKVLILDNITTAGFYMDMRPDEQAKVIKKIKDFASKHNIAVLIIAHTKKDVSDNMSRLITENDIRGGSSIVNLANFFYVLQRFELNDIYYPTIRIMKSRGQSVGDRLFYLKYSHQELTYTEDKKIDFKAFKEAYDMRNRL